MGKGWYGVDFDGTLAKTMDWKSHNEGSVGEPVWPMVERVKRWLAEGKEVRIMTARAGKGADDLHIANIKRFCRLHIEQELPITCEKDFNMIELWDDRAVQVEVNTGEPTTYWVSRAD
jgi:hypothetical protein